MSGSLPMFYISKGDPLDEASIPAYDSVVVVWMCKLWPEYVMQASNNAFLTCIIFTGLSQTIYFYLAMHDPFVVG